MIKRLLNIIIFVFIFALYFITFLFIYDTFRERKLSEMSKDALNLLEKENKKQEVNTNTVEEISATGISYGNFTVLGKLEIPTSLKRPYAHEIQTKISDHHSEGHRQQARPFRGRRDRHFGKERRHLHDPGQYLSQKIRRGIKKGSLRHKRKDRLGQTACFRRTGRAL